MSDFRLGWRDWSRNILATSSKNVGTKKKKNSRVKEGFSFNPLEIDWYSLRAARDV
jgi:hypothetical protein